MNIIRRLEMLEAAALKTRDDVGYKIVLLQRSESCEEGIVRSGLQDWPQDRIIFVNFVSPNDKPAM
jgi:hypothetical protein